MSCASPRVLVQTAADWSHACTGTIYQAIAEGSGFFQHGYLSRTSNGVRSWNCGSATMLEQNLPEQVKEKGHAYQACNSNLPNIRMWGTSVVEVSSLGSN